MAASKRTARGRQRGEIGVGVGGVAAALGAALAGGLWAATPTPAAAQECRFVDAVTGGTVCACRQDGSWRIVPEGRCASPAPAASTARPPARQGPSAAERAENADIQRMLNRVGCDAGAPDGVFGRRTNAAIACMRDALGVDRAGPLDADERRALLDAVDSTTGASEAQTRTVIAASLGVAPPAAPTPPAPAPEPEPAVIEQAPTPAPVPAPPPPAAPSLADILGVAPQDLADLCLGVMADPIDGQPRGLLLDRLCRAHGDETGDPVLSAVFDGRVSSGEALAAAPDAGSTPAPAPAAAAPTAPLAQADPAAQAVLVEPPVQEVAPLPEPQATAAAPAPEPAPAPAPEIAAGLSPLAAALVSGDPDEVAIAAAGADKATITAALTENAAGSGPPVPVYERLFLSHVIDNAAGALESLSALTAAGFDFSGHVGGSAAWPLLLEQSYRDAGEGPIEDRNPGPVSRFRDLMGVLIINGAECFDLDLTSNTVADEGFRGCEWFFQR